MKTKIPFRWILPAILPLQLWAAQPWREITQPTVGEAAAAFPQPPPEYGAIHWAIWGGPQSKEKVVSDLDHMQANGAHIIMINNSRGLQPKYFSPEYLDLVKFLVAECKKRGMKVWIENDAGYPDGMAGGLISKDYPELGMQALVADARYSVAAGQTLRIPVPPDTLGILAYNRQAGPAKSLPIPADGKFAYTAPNPGMSEVVFVRHVYRSSPTRYTNREDGTNDKDSLYSLIDYLNPEATRTYLKLIHETYEKIVGDEFGKTVLGFRGDEPDYTGFMPWTPKLLEVFREKKGYDLQPYLAQFFEPEFTPEVLRAKADYWDVWSGMFRDNYFKPQEEWCKARNMDFMVHLNHEELMLDLARGEDLIRNEGSFFRDMRYVGVPGVDNLGQIGPGIVADFPKLAASTAHLDGRPQVWTESGGTLHQAGKFVADYQLVRGINFLNIRGLNNPVGDDAKLLLNPSVATAQYVNRASYLLASGRPGAQVALFHPTDSMWLGDKESDDVTVKLVTELMEHQIDFDHIDTDAIVSDCTLADGGLKNLSGQVYRGIVIPSCTVIDRRMLDRLKAFAAAGGKVVFVGRTPTMVVGRSFMNPEPGAPDLSFATLEPQPSITPRVVAALPPSDVRLDAACPPVKYIRRTLKDGDVYFFFNESNQVQARTVTLAGTGQVQIWDAANGTIHPLAGTAPAAGSATIPLTLEPQESRFIVIGAVPPAAGRPWPTISAGQSVADLGGDWSVTLGDKQSTSTLKSWEQLGSASFAGTAGYRKEFTAPASLPAGKRVYLDLGNVHEDARVSLNGSALEVRSWPPYVWDVTALIKPGANTLEVRVQMPPAGGGRGGFGGGAGGPGGAGAGRRGGAAGAGPATAAAAPQGFAPTGVPGGLGENAGGGRGRGGPAGGGAAGGPPGGGGGRGGGRQDGGSAEATNASGLLGPVRLVAE
ncbi:MAG TPA: glycosyl hydrolase [Opitutaceae bacterium]|nr:glycosyl hydrolase [Opitutaceae bacterium]